MGQAGTNGLYTMSYLGQQRSAYLGGPRRRRPRLRRLGERNSEVVREAGEMVRAAAPAFRAGFHPRSHDHLGRRPRRHPGCSRHDVSGGLRLLRAGSAALAVLSVPLKLRDSRARLCADGPEHGSRSDAEGGRRGCLCRVDSGHPETGRRVPAPLPPSRRRHGHPRLDRGAGGQVGVSFPPPPLPDPEPEPTKNLADKYGFWTYELETSWNLKYHPPTKQGG